MANLQIKGIDDSLYEQIKALAASENRSVSQQILYLVKIYLANKKHYQTSKSPAEILLELSDSWQDTRNAAEIIRELRSARKNSNRLRQGL